MASQTPGPPTPFSRFRRRTSARQYPDLSSHPLTPTPPHPATMHMLPSPPTPLASTPSQPKSVEVALSSYFIPNADSPPGPAATQPAYSYPVSNPPYPQHPQHPHSSPDHFQNATYSSAYTQPHHPYAPTTVHPVNNTLTSHRHYINPPSYPQTYHQQYPHQPDAYHSPPYPQYYSNYSHLPYASKNPSYPTQTKPDTSSFPAFSHPWNSPSTNPTFDSPHSKRQHPLPTRQTVQPNPAHNPLTANVDLSSPHMIHTLRTMVQNGRTSVTHVPQTPVSTYFPSGHTQDDSSLPFSASNVPVSSSPPSSVHHPEPSQQTAVPPSFDMTHATMEAAEELSMNESPVVEILRTRRDTSQSANETPEAEYPNNEPSENQEVIALSSQSAASDPSPVKITKASNATPFSSGTVRIPQSQPTSARQPRDEVIYLNSESDGVPSVQNSQSLPPSVPEEPPTNDLLFSNLETNRVSEPEVTCADQPSVHTPPIKIPLSKVTPQSDEQCAADGSILVSGANTSTPDDTSTHQSPSSPVMVNGNTGGVHPDQESKPVVRVDDDGSSCKPSALAETKVALDLKNDVEEEAMSKVTSGGTNDVSRDGPIRMSQLPTEPSSDSPSPPPKETSACVDQPAASASTLRRDDTPLSGLNGQEPFAASNGLAALERKPIGAPVSPKNRRSSLTPEDGSPDRPLGGRRQPCRSARNPNLKGLLPPPPRVSGARRSVFAPTRLTGGALPQDLQPLKSSATGLRSFSAGKRMTSDGEEDLSIDVLRKPPEPTPKLPSMFDDYSSEDDVEVDAAKTKGQGNDKGVKGKAGGGRANTNRRTPRAGLSKADAPSARQKRSPKGEYGASRGAKRRRGSESNIYDASSSPSVSDDPDADTELRGRNTRSRKKPSSKAGPSNGNGKGQLKPESGIVRQSSRLKEKGTSHSVFIESSEHEDNSDDFEPEHSSRRGAKRAVRGNVSRRTSRKGPVRRNANTASSSKEPASQRRVEESKRKRANASGKSSKWTLDEISDVEALHEEDDIRPSQESERSTIKLNVSGLATRKRRKKSKEYPEHLRKRLSPDELSILRIAFVEHYPTPPSNMQVMGRHQFSTGREMCESKMHEMYKNMLKPWGDRWWKFYGIFNDEAREKKLEKPVTVDPTITEKEAAKWALAFHAKHGDAKLDKYGPEDLPGNGETTEAQNPEQETNS